MTHQLNQIDPALLTRSHQLLTKVEVFSPVDEFLLETTAVSGRVSLDATAETRGRCDLTINDPDLIPTDVASPFAPYGNELKVYRGLVDSPDLLVPLGRFRIEESEAEDTGDELGLSVTGLDRSVRVIEAAFEEPFELAAGTNFATAIEDGLREVIPDLETNFASTAVVTPRLIADEGDDRWHFYQGMAQALGAELFFDRDGVCVLRPIPLPGGAVKMDLIEGDDSLLLNASRRWHREETANRVIVTGENTGGAGAFRGVATDDNPLSPTYYFGGFGHAPLFWSSEYVTTDAQAEDAAVGLLAQHLGTTQEINFGAIVNPSLDPGDVIHVTRERLGIDEDHVVDSLEIPLSAEESMTGATRAVQVTADG